LHNYVKQILKLFWSFEIKTRLMGSCL